MSFQVSCECGKELTVAVGSAGTTIPCDCGRAVAVPQLRELRQAQDRRPAAANAGRRPARRKLPVWKKLLYATLVFGIAVLLLGSVAELGYRGWHGIPLFGGKLYEDDLRFPERVSRNQRDYLSRFVKSDNPILFYEPRPGYADDLYAINSHGFRDNEYAVNKPPGTFRIVVLGDSIIWGHRLPLEYSFAKVLEQQLNDKFERNFEVLNFGVSGYSTPQEVELYRVKASRFDPDLVIVGYCTNDYYDSSVEGAAFRRLYYDIFSKSYAFDHLCQAVRGLSYNKLGVVLKDGKAQFDLRQQFELLQRYHAGKRLIVVFPELYDFDNYRVGFEHERVVRAVEGLNYELLDLLDSLRQHDAETLIQVPHDRTHPNRLGMKLAVDATLEKLVAEQMIPLESAGTEGP